MKIFVYRWKEHYRGFISSRLSKCMRVVVEEDCPRANKRIKEEKKMLAPLLRGASESIGSVGVFGTVAFFDLRVTQHEIRSGLII